MKGDYSLSDLCRILRLSASGLRSCLHAALLSERSTRYSFQHLVILRTAKGLHEVGVSMRQIRKVLPPATAWGGQSLVEPEHLCLGQTRRRMGWDVALAAGF